MGGGYEGWEGIEEERVGGGGEYGWWEGTEVGGDRSETQNQSSLAYLCSTGVKDRV